MTTKLHLIKKGGPLNKKLITLFLLGMIVIALPVIYTYRTKNFSSCCTANKLSLSLKKGILSQGPTTIYQTKSFNLIDKLQGLSKRQLDEHDILYKGYVKQRNVIANALTTVDRSNLNRTYSLFRSLKIAETYAVNGQILHELYFENLGGAQTKIGEKMQNLIIQNFGSVENFKKDFFDCGQVARGWVITAYSLDDHQLHNFVLEEHNQHVPVLIVPLLVLDVYEHAYMIDYGATRNPYLDVFWQNIDWQVIESRINKWLH